MLDKVIVREALDTSEERLQTRPRPLYGIKYTTFTLTEQETGYIRRALELPDGLPFAMPYWPDQVKLSVTAAAGASVLTVESTDDSLWDTFNELAIIWTAFNSWELVSVGSVTTNTITLDNALAAEWSAGAWVVPIMFGHLKRNDKANITSEHSRFSVDFEERYFVLHVTPTASGEGTSACCQTVGQYFAPAYDPASDRIGVGYRGAAPNQYSAAKILMLSPAAPECEGLFDWSDTRVSGGAAAYATDQVFYMGVQGGELPDGAAGDELVVIVDFITTGIQFIGGFPNPGGVARGLNCVYIASVDRVWMQVKGCGGTYAFAIINPNDNTVVMVSDAALANAGENQWVYCPINECIYATREGAGNPLYKIDINTLVVTPIDLSGLGAVSLRCQGITYADAAPGEDGSGKIWVAYSDTGVTPTLYGIALLDPADDSITGGLVTSRANSILWYAGAFDFVLGNGGESVDEIALWKSDLTEGDSVDGYQMTAQGCYVDSQAKIVVPTYNSGEYCLTYFSASVSGLTVNRARITQAGGLRLTQSGGRRLLQ